VTQVPAETELPVRATAREVVAGLMGRVRHLPRVALTPFLVLFLVQGALLALGRAEGTQDSPLAALAILAAIPAVLFAYAAFLVDWVRLLVLGPDADGGTPRLSLGRRDARMLGAAILVAFLSILASIPGILLGMLAGGSPLAGAFGAVVTLVLALTAAASLGLILPPIAFDRTLQVSQAWAAAKAVLPRIAGIVALTLLPVHLLVSSSGVVYAMMLSGGGLVVPVMVLTLVLEFVELALLGALLVALYRRRIGDPSGGAAA